MALFKRKPQQRVTHDARVILSRSGRAGNVGFANDRVRKVTASKTAKFLKTASVVLILLVIGSGLLGFIGLIAYSLKSGTNLSLSQRWNGFIQSTPLKFLAKSDDIKVENREVVGLPGIPELPKSEFVFGEYIIRIGSSGFTVISGKLSATDSQSLYDFLTSGQSVYRLPINTEWRDVQEFYKAELTKLGWQYQLSASLTDTEKIPGEYYTKDKKGLHIYTVASDLWFESISEAQASQGLHDKIVAYKAKQELVEASSGHDLPSDAIWKLKYSRDWSVELQKNVVYGVNNIYFTNDVSKERVSISVLSRYKGVVADLAYKDLENVGREFISTWLTTQQTTVTLQGFAKTERMVADGKALEYVDIKNHAYFMFLLNKKNGLYYVVQYNGKENPEFFEYIKNNLKI